MIDKQEVEHIANLARLELNKKEIQKYQKQLDDILGYVKKLQEVDTTGIATADGGTWNLKNVFRQDKVRNKKLETKNLINMAPKKENGQIKVKSIFD